MPRYKRIGIFNLSKSGISASIKTGFGSIPLGRLFSIGKSNKTTTSPSIVSDPSYLQQQAVKGQQHRTNYVILSEKITNSIKESTNEIQKQTAAVKTDDDAYKLIQLVESYNSNFTSYSHDIRKLRKAIEAEGSFPGILKLMEYCDDLARSTDDHIKAMNKFMDDVKTEVAAKIAGKTE